MMAKEEIVEKLPLSVVMVVRNEAANMRDCLAAVAFAREIIVVDDFSEDATPQLAASFGAKVFTRAMAGDWGAQQTFAIGQATQPWILLLDGDERITPPLAEEIKKCVLEDKKYAYEIKRLNHFKRVPVRHGVLRPDYVLRLMPREGARVEGQVHPKIITPFPPKRLREPMLHYTYEKWGAYLNKLEKYTRLAAEKAYGEGKRARFWSDIVFRPFFAFFKMYFLQGGFLDGKIGWILSANHYFYTEMKYVRLYFLARERDAVVDCGDDDGFHTLAANADWSGRLAEIREILRQERGQVLADNRSSHRPRFVLKATIAGTDYVIKHERFRFRFDRSLKAFLYGSDTCRIFKLGRRARERGFDKIPQMFFAAEKFSNGILREAISVTEFLDGRILTLPLEDRQKNEILQLMRESHRAGVISGDVQRDNFIATDAGVRLIDFRGNKIFGALAKARDRIQLQATLGVPARDYGIAEKIFLLQNTVRNWLRVLAGKEKIQH
ncbi:MAG: glycosyltransferase [Opitutales bacterium]|nr:glycosyltransferase [Opitutales bacterium]